MMPVVVIVALIALIGLAVDCLIIGGRDPRKWKGGKKD